MGIFDLFSSKRNRTASHAWPTNPWSNTDGNASNPINHSAANPTTEASTSADLTNGATSTSNAALQGNSQVNGLVNHQSNNSSSTPKAITGNGEETVLGYGFASSYELSKRGYRDGITVQTLGDMNEGVSLVLAEYQAHLNKEIHRYEDEKDTCYRILARSGNISEQFDAQYEEIIESVQRKIAKYEAYKLEIQKPEGQAAAIVTAYKRGYQAGVGKHRLYLGDAANNNKAD